MGWATNYLSKKGKATRKKPPPASPDVPRAIFAKWQRPKIGWLPIGPTRKQRRDALERGA